MKISKTVSFVIVIIIVLLGGWYYMSKKPIEPIVGQKSVETFIKISSDPKLGDYLVASNGMTLYMFTKDILNTSNCYDTCAVNWPPYSTPINEPLVAGDNISSELTTITRNDGVTQLAYKGIPLYFWKNDAKPGDTTGQNIGGVWFVVKPN